MMNKDKLITTDGKILAGFFMPVGPPPKTVKEPCSPAGIDFLRGNDG